MKKLLLVLLPLACVIAGCKYDDSDVWDELNSQKSRIAALETLTSTMNGNISSLQTITAALQGNVTVTSVKATDNGYVINFSDGTSATIENGKDGSTPLIGAKADSDGLYYWTIDGQWLTDASGKKVPTGITPKLKIENDQWFITYDNGTTWSKVEGQQASISCVFKSVTTDAYNATFTLSDGTSITVPLTATATKLQLLFDESVFEKMRDGEVLNTTYTITAPEGVVVDFQTFESDGWKVTVYPTDDRTGRFSVKAPEKMTPTKILFMLTDDNGGSFLKIISIAYNEEAKPYVKTEYVIDPEGGELVIPVSSCTADLDEDALEWVEVKETGDRIVLNFTSNEAQDYRHATLTIEDGTVISITQIDRDALVLSSDTVEIDGRRQKVNFIVSANISVTATVTSGSEWLSVSPTTKGLTDKVFTFTASRNTTGEERTATVEFSGKALSQTCTVIQAPYDGPDEIDVTEAIATEEGEEINISTSLVVALTADGYLIADTDNVIFVSDASNKPSLGDSVKFSSFSETFYGFTALGNVEEFSTSSKGNRVTYPTATDITGTIDSFEASRPQYVSVTGDLTVTDGVYSLAVKDAETTVIVHEPASIVGLETLDGHNVTVSGYYYGTTDGTACIIATKKNDNGQSGGSGGGSTTTGYIYKKATTVTSGKPYLIVAAGSSSLFAAKPVTSNYGYLKVDTVTDSDGVITLTARDNEFTITSTSSGYTILQPDGRYLYQTGTYNSFNVDASPSSGQYWTIDAQGDGTFKITNNSVNKFVQYATSYSSYGSYANAQSGGVLPCLYEYAGETEIDDGGQGGEDPGDEPGGDQVFRKVTSSLSDWSGEYLIVYEDGSLALDGSQTNLKGTNASPRTISVTISGNTIAATSTTLASTFTISGSGSSYTITSKSGYKIGNTSDANDLKCATNGTYVNTISYDSSEGGVDIESSSSHLRYNSASNANFFRYYKSTTYKNQQTIQLYKLEK